MGTTRGRVWRRKEKSLLLLARVRLKRSHASCGLSEFWSRVLATIFACSIARLAGWVAGSSPRLSVDQLLHFSFLRLISCYLSLFYFFSNKKIFGA